MSDQRTRTVEIPEPTADALSGRLDGTEFESIDEYAAFALDRLLDELDRHGSSAVEGDADARPAPDAEGSDSVESRLESLGYL